MALNKGFSIVEVLIIVLVVALAGFIGWKVWDATNTPKPTPVAPVAPVSSDIKNKQDLDKADKTLDSTNVDGDEAKQLDSQANF